MIVNRCWPKSTSHIDNRVQGFTLIEVIVALAITAIALIAGFKASHALTDSANRQHTVLLSHICAENTLIGLRLARQLPDIGDKTFTCSEAGQNFSVYQNVQPTPNPHFRRVQATVVDQGWRVLTLSTLVGSQ